MLSISRWTNIIPNCWKIWSFIISGRVSLNLFIIFNDLQIGPVAPSTSRRIYRRFITVHCKNVLFDVTGRWKFYLESGSFNCTFTAAIFVLIFSFLLSQLCLNEYPLFIYQNFHIFATRAHAKANLCTNRIVIEIDVSLICLCMVWLDD